MTHKETAEYCKHGSPVEASCYECDKEEKERMILRDQFAMAALNGLCSLNWRTKSTIEPTAKDHAEQAYKYADAMLDVREIKS